MPACPQTGRDGLRAYLQTEQAHLLRAYDLDFLTDAIETAKARCYEVMLAPQRFDGEYRPDGGFASALRPEQVPLMSTLWVRFTHAGTTGFGTLEGEHVRVYRGEHVRQPLAH